MWTCVLVQLCIVYIYRLFWKKYFLIIICNWLLLGSTSAQDVAVEDNCAYQIQASVNRTTEMDKSAYGTGYIASAHGGGVCESQDEENIYEPMLW